MSRRTAFILTVLLLSLTTGCLLGRAKTPEEQVAAYLESASRKKQTGDFEGAILDLDLALGILPESGHALVRRGSLYVEINDVEAAQGDFQRALELDPDDVAAHIGRAVVRRRLGDFDGAMVDLNRAVELAPDLSQVYLARGMTLAMNGQTQAAIDDLTQAIQIAPSLTRAHLWRAYAYLALHDEARAARDLRFVRDHSGDALLVQRATTLLNEIYLSEP